MCDVEFSVGSVDALDRGADAGRQNHDLVAGPDGAGTDLSCIAPVVGVLGGARPDHVLDGEPQTDVVSAVHVGVDRDRLEVLDEVGPS